MISQVDIILYAQNWQYGGNFDGGGFINSVVEEALSAGIPALVSRDSAMSEVAGAAGVSVDPLSEAEMTDALHRLSIDPQLYRGLCDHAVEESRRYDWNLSAVKMLSILKGDAV